MIIFLGILPLLNFLLGDDSLPAKFTISQFRNTTKTRKYFELSPDICITKAGITSVVLLFIRFTCVKNLNLVLLSKYLADWNSSVLNK